MFTKKTKKKTSQNLFKMSFKQLGRCPSLWGCTAHPARGPEGDAQGICAKAAITSRRCWESPAVPGWGLGSIFNFFLLLFFPEVPGRRPWMVAHPRPGEVPQVKARSALLPPHWAEGTNTTVFKAFWGCFDGFLLLNFVSVWLRQAHVLFISVCSFTHQICHFKWQKEVGG